MFPLSKLARDNLFWAPPKSGRASTATSRPPIVWEFISRFTTSKPDDKTHKTNATFQFTVKKGTEQVMQFKETSAEMKQTGDQVTIERWLPLSSPCARQILDRN